MDSYTFSSDSTSSFFIKETPLDDNVVDMDITNSILQLNNSDEIREVENAIVAESGASEMSDKVGGDYKEDSHVGSSEVFVITVGNTNEGVKVVLDANNTSENVKNVEFEALAGSDGSINDDTVTLNDDVSLNEPVEDINTLNSNLETNEDVVSDNDDKFDMTQFLSPKVNKPIVTTVTNGRNNKRNGAVKEYFTDIGSNSVKCNLCSDVLLNNYSNLALHLRHVHKNDKSETNFGKAWKYFTKIDLFKAKCKLCSNTFIYRNRMSTLVKHLRVMHIKQTGSDFKNGKSATVAVSTEENDDTTNVDDEKPSNLPSDVIVIQNSDGKLLNQIKVNKSWKCFTKLPNSDKMICNLCKKIFTHNKTTDLLQHLHEEHKNLLSFKQQITQQSFDEIDDNHSLEGISDEVGFENTIETKNSVQNVSKATRFGRSAKSNKIWEYFTSMNNEKIMCNLCNKILSNNYSSSNLLRHLSARHVEVYNTIKDLPALDTKTVKVMMNDETGQPENDVSVADVLEDYENMLKPNEIVQIGTSPKLKQPVSETWKYYTKLKSLSKVRCKLCNAMLSYTEGISSNLTRHLKSKHVDVLNKRSNFVYTKESNEQTGKWGVKKEMSDLPEISDGSTAVDSEQLESIEDSSNVDLSDHLLPVNNVDVSVSSNVESELGPQDCSIEENDSQVQKTVVVNKEFSSPENISYKRRSKAWDYFKKVLPKNVAVCNLCSLEIPFSKGSTNTLFRHLSSKHDINLNKSAKLRKVFAYESDTSTEEIDKDESANCTEKVNEDIEDDAPCNDDASDLPMDNDESNDLKCSQVKVVGRMWRYFTKLDRDKAKCNTCGKMFVYKLGQTSHLIKHIQVKHKDVAATGNSTPMKNISENKSSDNSKIKEPRAAKTFQNSSSVIQRYFTEIGNSKAMCNLCEFPNVLSSSKYSRSNLIRHLNRKHASILELANSSEVCNDKTSEVNDTPMISTVGTLEIDNSVLTDFGIKKENDPIRINETDEVQDMRALFEYLETDDKLKNCIKYEDNQIKCKICSGSFVCDNIINYEYTIRYHVQLFHAEWTVMCCNDTIVKRECPSPLPDPDPSEMIENSETTEANYNELEAIANEVSSFLNVEQQDSVKQLKKANDNVVSKEVSKNSNRTLADDIWKYFTKMTSQNVRCNFCSILISFRQHKKWNLIRHLKLKHKRNVNLSLYKKKAHLNVNKSKSRVKLEKNKTSKVNSKASFKKTKSSKPVKKVNRSISPTKVVKSSPHVNKVNEVDKKPNVVKKNSSSDKSSKTTVKRKDKMQKEKKPSPPLASFNTPINRKIGRTWSHFTKIEMGKAQCNICNIILLYRGTGIDLLNEHLTSQHLSFFDGSSGGSETQKCFTKKTNFDTKSSESSDDSDVDEKERDFTPISQLPSCDVPSSREDKETEDSIKKKESNRVWQYFTKTVNGFAECHLCLCEISFKGSTNSLMRHLQKIHSVISLLTPVKGSKSEPEETEQSKLLAAVDLTPTRSQEKNHVCFIRLSKNMVRCNFCPRLLYHKCGNMHKLMSHLLFNHRQETVRYKSLKDVKFSYNGKEIILKAVERQDRQVAPLDVLMQSEQKVDRRKIYRSNTWLYFTKLNDHYAKCKVCSNAFSYKGGSIYNLTRHLLIKHDVKLIKRFEVPYRKISTVNLPTPKCAMKKRNETLLFYKRINRHTVRCKLCMKRFTYNGMNINRLVNHLWSSHITKLIGPSGPPLYPNNVNSAEEVDEQIENDPSESTETRLGVGDNVSGGNKDSSSTGRKTSSTWNYFTELNGAERRVMCNICQKIYCFKSGNLSNLSRHLEKHHNIIKASSSVSNPEPLNDDGITTSSDGNDVRVNTSEQLNCTNKDPNMDENEIYNFFLKSNCSDDELQCKFCNDVLKRDNLLNLRTHLLSNHDISDFLSKSNKEMSAKEFSEAFLTSSVEEKSSLTSETNKTSRMKCKLCYKELVMKKSSLLVSLIEHLKTVHKQDLSEEENVILDGNLYLNLEPTENVDKDITDNEASNTTKKEAQINIQLKFTVLNYFKNLKLFKNRCTVCYKFISSKRPCNHRITNDLCIRYGITSRRKTDNTKTSDGETESVGISVSESGKSDDIVKKIDNKKKRSDAKKVKHFMSINVYDNKCYDCMATHHDGYCVHSINMWIMNENKKHLDQTKGNSEFSNHVSLNSDEVKIIADSLNGCSENNIIIITDNEDTSILNYDLTGRNEGGSQDISYHIMNSINDIDDDDIKVIIYNYNSEGAENENQISDNSGVKIKELPENTSNDIPSSSNKVLEEHINNIVEGLNNPEVVYNSENAVVNNEDLLKSKEDATSVSLIEEVDASTKPSENNEVSTNDENISEPVEPQKSYDLEKLTELAEVSCNEQFYKQNSLLNSAEQIESSDSSSIKSPQLKPSVISKSSSDRCIVENIYPEDDSIDHIEKEYVTESIVYNNSDTDNNYTVEVEAPKEADERFVETIDDSLNKDAETVTQLTDTVEANRMNEVISEDVINAIFNEVIVNIQEQPDDKEVNLIKINDDNIEIPSGLYLQSLKNQYKIHKIVLYFSNISYEYRTAKCNLCKLYLEFSEPIIYNLLMHLFTYHKDKVCTDESINKTLITETAAIDPVSRPRKKSPVWKYFVNDGNFRATCKICCFSFSYKGGAINNLSRHLRLRHDILVSSKHTDNMDYDGHYMVSYPKRRSAVKLRSKTWNYFSKEPNDWAKCRICKKYLSYRSSTINNLTRHLRTIHSKIFSSLFTKDPIFVKNEDGTVTENLNFFNNDENSDIYNEIMLETTNTKSRDEILQQCSYSSLENNKRKSIVWNYFTEVTPNCGKCNFCSKVISCKGGGTSNLSRHLRSRHGIWIVLTSNLSQTFNETMNDPELNQYTLESKNRKGDTANDTIITQEQLHILKNRKLVHKKSKTWEYFTKETPDRVRCNLCSKPLSYKCKAVHNLRRHLAKKHPSYVVKQDPVRLKLQINTEHDVLHNSNEVDNPLLNESDKKFIDITDTSVVIVDEETQVPPLRPDRNARPKKSIVWNYFEELEYGIAKCLICSKILSFRGGGTNNLMRHLRCRHSIIIVNQVNVDMDSLEKEPVVVMGDTDMRVEIDPARDSAVTEQETIEMANVIDDPNVSV